MFYFPEKKVLAVKALRVMTQCCNAPQHFLPGVVNYVISPRMDTTDVAEEEAAQEAAGAAQPAEEQFEEEDEFSD
jgi:hypothetical protein